MKLENSFSVPATPDRSFAFLLDVERVAPCLPGAEITETVDDRTWKGKVSLKLGPVSMSYAGTLVLDEADEGDRRVVLKAQGTETRGKGSVTATVTSTLEPEGEGTRVGVVTDLSISGAAAQYGRGMIGDISQRFTDEFANCLSRKLASEHGGGGEEEAAGSGGDDVSETAGAKPISGLSLGSWALVRAVGRLFGRG